MRMSELSERSGVAVPSIKFYLREALLPPGEYSSPNQASYGDEHVQRLRLVRALIDVGGLSVSAVRAVLAAVDNTDMPLDWAFGVAQHALPTMAPVVPGSGADEITRLLDEADWSVSVDNPGRDMAARVIDSYERLGQGNLIAVLPEYLRAAEIIAEADLAAVARAEGRSAMVETVVIGTVLGDSLLAGLRRIAQERASDVYFPAPAGIDDCDPDTEESTQ